MWVDGKWHCELCDQVVAGEGPWCDLYCEELRKLCRPRAKRLLHQADAHGDGPLVNALCWYGRAKWGEDIDW